MMNQEKMNKEDRGVPSTEIRDYLHEENVEGFEIKLANIPKNKKVLENPDGTPMRKPDGSLIYKRDETIAQNIKLETKHLRELENSGYIKREKVGREYRLSITDSGEYVACISFE